MEKVRNKIHGNHNPYEGLEILPKDLQGWGGTDTSFETIIGELKPNLIVEVGSWKGLSATHMANTALKLGIDRENLEIVCVDTWLSSVEHYSQQFSGLYERKLGRPDLYEQFLSNVVHEGFSDIITPFPIDSINGSECFSMWGVRPDLIYIDAAHDYQSVKLDVYLWGLLVRDGGYLLFDDWHHEPIRRAVHEVFGYEKVFTIGGKAAWIK